MEATFCGIPRELRCHIFRRLYSIRKLRRIVSTSKAVYEDIKETAKLYISEVIEVKPGYTLITNRTFWHKFIPGTAGHELIESYKFNFTAYEVHNRYSPNPLHNIPKSSPVKYTDVKLMLSIFGTFADEENGDVTYMTFRGLPLDEYGIYTLCIEDSSIVLRIKKSICGDRSEMKTYTRYDDEEEYYPHRITVSYARVK